jgi:hypothetical protein
VLFSILLAVCTSKTPWVVDQLRYMSITHIPRLHILKHRPVAWIECQASRSRRAGKDEDDTMTHTTRRSGTGEVAISAHGT